MTQFDLVNGICFSAVLTLLSALLVLLYMIIVYPLGAIFWLGFPLFGLVWIYCMVQIIFWVVDRSLTR